LSLPKRPKQHLLESASRVAFERALAPGWIYRPESIDYGIDGTVEVVTSSGNVTGRRFAVQLKATAATTWRSFGIESSTAAYFRALSMPVLLVRYRSANDLLLVQWAHDLPKSHSGKAIRVSERRMTKWEAGTSERIEAELRQWAGIRDPSLARPISLTLDIPPTEFCGHDTHELARAIDEAAARAPGLLKIGEIPEPESLGVVRFASTGVYVSLPAGCRFRIEASTREVIARLSNEALASDTILAVVGALLDARQREYALPLLRSVILTSSLIDQPNAVSIFATALASAHDVVTLLSMTKELLNRGKLDAMQVCWVLAAMAVDAGSTADQDRFRRDAIELLGDIEMIGDPFLTAASHYNVGRFFIRRGLTAREGLRHFRIARKFNAAYLNRDYFWQDIGAILFESGKYNDAVCAYQRAIDFGADPNARATLADSLTHAGRYEEAADEFRKYARSSKAPDPRWLLRGLVQEKLVAAAESEVKQLEAKMAAPGFYENHVASKPIIDRHQKLMWEVGDLMNQWEALQSETKV